MDTRSKARQTLGSKRDTLAAQLEEDPALASSRRSARAVQYTNSMSKNYWERRMVALQDRITQLESQITERDNNYARVQAENARLVERDKVVREAKAGIEASFVKLKEEATTTRAELTALVGQLATTNAGLQDAKETLEGTIKSLESRIFLLERKLSTTDAELQASQAAVTTRQNIANTLRAQLEELQSENRTLKAASAGNTGRDKEWAIIKQELAHQTSHITHLERTNAQLTRQLQTQHNAELVHDENKSLKSKITDLTAEIQRMARAETELRAAAAAASQVRYNEQAARERDEMESELAKLRVQNATLLDQVGELRSAAKSNKVSGRSNVLDREEDDVKNEGEDSEAMIADLEDEVTRMREMVAALQVKVRVGSEERSMLRSILSSMHSDADEMLAARIGQLENLWDQKDSENDTVDMSMRSQVGDVTFSTVRWEAMREREKREQVEQEMAELAKQIEAHEETIERLEQTLFELRGEITAGTHAQPGTRVLQLADNPEAKWFAMREEQVGRMRDELEVLRDRFIQGGDSGLETTNEVLREMYINLQAEKKTLQGELDQRDMRARRLKSVFNSKAIEFRETISSLLGYKLHFERTYVRLTSAYDKDIDFKFTSEHGNQAVMWPIQIGSGVQNKEDVENQILQLKSLWIDQKQNVPCFLAQLTMYAYERAEMGLSDWAGLDG